jgi:heme exporter protein CcmD
MTWSTAGAGVYVWSAYLITLAVLMGEVWYLVRRHRSGAVSRGVNRAPSSQVSR